MLKRGSVFNAIRRHKRGNAQISDKKTASGRKEASHQQINKITLKTLAKKVEQAVETKNAELAKESLIKAMKAYDKAASQGILHKSTSSRKIARLSTKVGKISAA